MFKAVKKHAKSLVVGAVALSSTAASAAAVALPATAEADIVGSIGVGGGLMITAGVAVVGFVVVAKLMKKI